MRPSRSALRRTRSAWASTTLEEWLLTPMPSESQRSRHLLVGQPELSCELVHPDVCCQRLAQPLRHSTTFTRHEHVVLRGRWPDSTDRSVSCGDRRKPVHAVGPSGTTGDPALSRSILSATEPGSHEVTRRLRPAEPSSADSRADGLGDGVASSGARLGSRRLRRLAGVVVAPTATSATRRRRRPSSDASSAASASLGVGSSRRRLAGGLLLGRRLGPGLGRHGLAAVGGLPHLLAGLGVDDPLALGPVLGGVGLFLGQLGLALDVDAPAGEAGGEAGVLALLADGQRQLVVGDDDLGGAGAPRRCGPP